MVVVSLGRIMFCSARLRRSVMIFQEMEHTPCASSSSLGAAISKLQASRASQMVIFSVVDVQHNFPQPLRVSTIYYSPGKWRFTTVAVVPHFYGIIYDISTVITVLLRFENGQLDLSTNTHTQKNIHKFSLHFVLTLRLYIDLAIKCLNLII